MVNTPVNKIHNVQLTYLQRNERDAVSENNRDQLQGGRSGKAFLSKGPCQLRPEGQGIGHLKRTDDHAKKRGDLVWGCPRGRERPTLVLVYTVLMRGYNSQGEALGDTGWRVLSIE